MTIQEFFSNSEEVFIPERQTINVVYLNEYLKKTVTFSQIINWAEIFQASGISYTVMIMPGYSGYLFRGGRKRIMENAEKARSVIGDCIHVLPVPKPGSFIAKVFLTLILFFHFHRILLCKEPVIVISRSPKLGLSLSFLRKLFPRVKFIFDCRGTLEEEYLLSNARCMNERVQTKADQISDRTLEVIRESNLVFYVSYKLKEHYQTLSVNFGNTRFIVVPTCADSSTFFFDPGIRQSIRSKYSVNDDIILLYSGALAKQWQIPERLFHIVGTLLRNNGHFRFWCLTPDTDIAEELASRYHLPNDRFMTLYSEYGELCSFLNAADFSLLFRDPSPVNEVAAPTKFAEYLMCGIPVIISEGIGDYSEYIKKNRMGLCLNPDEDDLIIVKNILDHINNSVYNRAEISEVAKKIYSKQAHIYSIFSALKGLSKMNNEIDRNV